MENACITYMGEHIKVLKFELKSLLGGFLGSKHDSETRITNRKWWNQKP
jgi:hypothetical protein